MDTEARNQVRLIHDTKTEYAHLNELIAKKQQLDNQIADLLQQVAALKRKATEIDAQFRKEVISVRPSIVPDKSTTKTRTPDKTRQIIDLLKKNPQLISKLADLDLDLDLGLG